MLLNALVLGCRFLIFFVTFIWLIRGNELHIVEDKNVTSEEVLGAFLDDFNEKFEFMKFCEAANLNVSVVTDSHSYSVTVSFMLSHPKYKDCFEYYDITLEKRRKRVDFAKVKYRYDEQRSISYEFENVACGIYEITIHPYYNSWQPAPIIIKYPEIINVTSFECIGLVRSNKLIFEQHIEKKIIVIIAVFSAFLIFAVSGVFFCYYKSGYGGKTDGATKGYEAIDIKDDESCKPASNIEVYIIHYYGRNIKNKLKIEAFKNFCKLSGYYNAVKTIEDELHLILFNVNDQLSEMLKKKREDGSLRKIVLIVSCEDEEDSSHELENIIFYKFLDKVKDNIEECCKGYDHFFVVKLDYSMNSKILEDIVRRTRFTLSDKLLDDHLIDLCLNLCSGSNLNLSEVERDLRKLLAEHPIQHLESMV